MKLERVHKPSMTPVDLSLGDTLVYTRGDGGSVTLELLRTDAYVLERDYARYAYAGAKGEISVYGFSCVLRIDDEEIEIRREAGSQASFYEPLRVAGIQIWLDAVRRIFDTSYDHHNSAGGFMVEKDFLQGLVCMPRQDARLVVQDADASICPEPLGFWCDLPHGGLRIEDCYNGEDCWMGPYGGAFAHCGLDINMPKGSRLYAPVALDTQHYHTTVASGFRNNRWNGLRQWADKSIWRLSASHIIDPLVPEHTPLERGEAYATTAGTAVGAHTHTHFNLHVTEQGGNYFLDPWILFRQMLKDNV